MYVFLTFYLKASNELRDRSTDVYLRPMALYSFSFAPNYTSTKIYPSGAEYLEYLHGSVQKYDLGSQIHLNSDVTQVQFIAEELEWEVTISRPQSGTVDTTLDERSNGQYQVLETEIVRAKIVVSGVGVLVQPNDWPFDGPSLQKFEGEVIHSSRLKNIETLIDKKVILVGSGCSAAQIVPALLKEGVSSLTQIMRTPPWVEPRLEEPFGKEK